MATIDEILSKTKPESAPESQELKQGLSLDEVLERSKAPEQSILGQVVRGLMRGAYRSVASVPAAAGIALKAARQGVGEVLVPRPHIKESTLQTFAGPQDRLSAFLGAFDTSTVDITGGNGVIAREGAPEPSKPRLSHSLTSYDLNRLEREQAIQKSPLAQKLNTAAEAAFITSDAIHNFAEETFPKPPSVRAAESDGKISWGEVNPLTKPGLEMLLSTTLESVPDMGLAMAGGGVPKALINRLPRELQHAASIAIMGNIAGAQESIPLYKEAKQKGLSDDDALEAFGMGMVGSAVLNSLGFESILGKIPTKDRGRLLHVLGKTAIGATGEGSTEATEEAMQTTILGENPAEHLPEYALAALSGAAIGGPIANVDALIETLEGKDGAKPTPDKPKASKPKDKSKADNPLEAPPAEAAATFAEEHVKTTPDEAIRVTSEEMDDVLPGKHPQDETGAQPVEPETSQLPEPTQDIDLSQGNTGPLAKGDSVGWETHDGQWRSGIVEATPKGEGVVRVRRDDGVLVGVHSGRLRRLRHAEGPQESSGAKQEQQPESPPAPTEPVQPQEEPKPVEPATVEPEVVQTPAQRPAETPAVDAGQELPLELGQPNVDESGPAPVPMEQPAPKDTVSVEPIKGAQSNQDAQDAAVDPFEGVPTHVIRKMARDAGISMRGLSKREHFIDALKKKAESYRGQTAIPGMEDVVARQERTAEPTEASKEAPQAKTPPSNGYEIVQRWEEPGVGRASIDKPHGIYTTPATVDSPHKNLGGKQFFWRKNKNANVLDVSDVPDAAVAMRPSATTAGAGVKAVYALYGEKRFNELKNMTRKELQAEAEKMFPGPDYSLYYDTQEIMEAIGAQAARSQNYDAIQSSDHLMPEFDEYVALTQNAMTPIDEHGNVVLDAQPKITQPTPAPAQSTEEPVAEPTEAPKEAPQAETPSPNGYRRKQVGEKISQGEIVLTNTNRPTTPYPKVDTSTNQKTANTLKRNDAWLVDNAIAEAESRGDDFNLTTFRGMKDRPLSDSDRNLAEEYLFGDYIPPAKGGIQLKPLAPEGKPEPSTPTPKPPLDTKAPVTPNEVLVQSILDHLKLGRGMTEHALFRMADAAFGGTMAEGKYGPSEAYDAMETAINKYIAWMNLSPSVSAKQAKANIFRIRDILSSIPKQKNRSGERDSHQQFSTPADYAYAVAWIAGITSADTVLEPSAGTGNLAVHATTARATVFVNELSDRRADLVSSIDGIAEVMREDAEQIHNILPANKRPTVVLMNPPFSRAPKRMGNKKVIGTDLKHIDAALKALRDGGRLVAVIGAPLSGQETATFSSWFRKVRQEYNIRAVQRIERGVYAGQGTTFPTRVVVIDKTGPTPEGQEGILKSDEVSLSELIDRMEDVKNDRRITEQAATEPVVPEDASGARPGTKRESSVRDADTGVDANQPPIEGAASNAEAHGNDEGVRIDEPEQSGGVSPAPPGHGGEHTGERGPSIQGSSQRNGDRTGESTTGKSVPESVDVEATAITSTRKNELSESIYVPYETTVSFPGAHDHPAEIVESAAMSAVDPPTLTYSPKLPKNIIESGDLSKVQIEAIARAGQAHEVMIEVPPIDNKPQPDVRQGFMIGDGTGVGKGRTIGGIILDNMARGRKKAVWFSVSQNLFGAAQSDWADLKQDKNLIFNQNTFKANDKITTPDGILFTTYATAIQSAKAQEGKPGQRRIDQLIDWLGGDSFDGVIVFDESHAMANAIGVKPSQRALIGLELQQRLPKARVVYVSATAATEVENFAYADRLGLWGPNTAFNSKWEFISSISSRGVAAMEIVARDLKALGLFLARSISFNGVEFGRVEHNLTAEQVKIYDDLAEGWQVVLQNVYAALDITEGNAWAVKNALGQFWSNHQRFFNQVITAMSLPSVLEQMDKDIAEGKAIVVQLTNTHESAQRRELAKRSEDESLDDFDLTPRDSLLQYIENSFPTIQYEEYIDENGNTQSRPVKDSKGNYVHNQDALRKKEELLNRLASIRVPQSPLDMLINHFGSENISEVTSRKERVIRDKNGSNVREKRGKNVNKAEIAAFMSGKKNVLVFSEAGGTGASYHASRNAKNQKQRVHYVLQAGWKADAAVQGMGRSHRSNQASTPIFRLVTTNLQGQRRFISTIARRLEQLGALSKGQRQAGATGLFGPEDNLESTEAREALERFYRDLYNQKIEGISIADFQAKTGLRLVDSDGRLIQDDLQNIKQFLNRLLSMKVEDQNRVFGEFEERLIQRVELARQDGTLDQGMETYRAKSIKKIGEQVVYVHPGTNVETKYVRVAAQLPIQRMTLAQARARVRNRQHRWLKNARSGRIYAVISGGSRTQSDGSIVEYSHMYSPTGKTRSAPSHELESENWNEVPADDVEATWNAEYEKAPDTVEVEEHLITGIVLPIWDRFTDPPRIVRMLTDEGEQILGLLLNRSSYQDTLRRLGVDPTRPKLSTQEALDGLLENEHALTLANDWMIQRSRVNNEYRIEVLFDPSISDVSKEVDAVRALGGFSERINYRMRAFLPTGQDAVSVLDKVLKKHPIVDIDTRRSSSGRGPAGADYGAVDGIITLLADIKDSLDKILNNIRRQLPALQKRIQRLLDLVTALIKMVDADEYLDPEVVKSAVKEARSITRKHFRDGKVRTPKKADSIFQEIEDAPMPEIDIIDKTGTSDIGILRHYIQNIEHMTRVSLDPRKWSSNQRLAVKLTEASLMTEYQKQQDLLAWRAWLDTLGKKKAKMVRPALEAFRAGDDIGNYPADVQAAAKQIAQYFDDMRNAVKEFKRDEWHRRLRKIDRKLYDAVLDVLDGKMSAEEASDKYDSDLEIIEDEIAEYHAIDSWGIDDYITNIEIGGYIVKRTNGDTITIARSRREASRKIARWLRENDDVEDTTFILETTGAVFNNSEVGAYLTKEQHQRLQYKLKGELERRAEGLEKDVIEQAVRGTTGRVVRVVPTKKFAGPMQQRKDVLLGEENIFDALLVYSVVMRTKLNIDPVLDDIRDRLGRMPPNLRAAFQSVAEDTRGIYGIDDKFIDEIARRFGAPMGLNASIQAKVRRFTAYAKLGYRPVMWLQNRLGARIHMYAFVGEKYVAKGKRFLRTEEGMALLDQEHPYLGATMAMSETGGRVLDKPRWWQPMFFHSSPEFFDRKLAYAANYMYAKESMGLSEKNAREFARQGVRLQLFSYNVAAMPKLLRNTTRRTLLQFKSYILFEIQYYSTLWKFHPKAFVKFVATQTILFGPRFWVYFLRALPLIGVWAGWDDLDEWMANIPFAGQFYRGVIGAGTGADITSMAVPQFPHRIDDLWGPAVGDAVALYKMVAEPALRHNTVAMVPGNIDEWAKRTVLAYRNMSDLFDGLSDDGWIRDERGNKVYELSSSWDRFLIGAGARPVALENQRIAQRNIVREGEAERDAKFKVITEILNHERRTGRRASDLRRKARQEHGITAGDIARRKKIQNQTPAERFGRYAGKDKRRAAAERLTGAR